jgi:hypothetical protein
MFIPNNSIFQAPFTCIVAGPTQSGKTTLIRSILEKNHLLINPKPSKIFYCYAAWQSSYEKLREIWPKIEFIEGILEIDSLKSIENNLIILDDLMNKCENDERILELFTTHSHHNNISVFLLTQNIYSKGKHSRTISLNSNYMLIMNNPRDRSQIQFLARQMYPSNPKFLIEVYEDATTSVKYGHLFIDLTQKTNEEMRVQSGITDDSQRIIYQEKK